MTAYEFTRFEADRTHLLKVKGYDIDTIAFQIDYSNPGKDCFRDTKEYAEAKDIFIELTMSCDLEEAIGWMKYWMLSAIAYASETKELDWRIYFIAAYDLYNKLSGHSPKQVTEPEDKVKKTWSEDEIKHMIQTNDKALYGALKKLYSFQTEDEQRACETRENNGVGFNGVDGPFMSSICQFLISNGFLTPKQKAAARNRLVKYNKQLTRIANA